MRDFAGCLSCGKPFPPEARVDRRYCNKTCNNRHYKRICRGRAEPVARADPVALLNKMQPVQVGWVAAIIEGEGSIVAIANSRHSGNVYTYASVHVAMADEDVVRRLQEWTGLGRVSGPHLPPCRAKAGHKPQWVWRVAAADQVFALLDLIGPLLGNRRQGQAKKLRRRMAERTLIRNGGIHS